MTAVARIPGYDPLEMGFTKKESRRFAKFVQYGIIAADEAMAQANFDLEAEDLSRFACVFGTGIGGMEIFERESVVLNTKRKTCESTLHPDHDPEHDRGKPLHSLWAQG